MFQKKEKKKVAPKPSKVEEPEEIEEAEDMEEEDYEEDEDPIETLPRQSKKKEVSTELTEDMVRRAIENLVYRVSRIEHHLRLDY